ncbi:MAG: hypothetical protein KDC13_00955 [Bacteroidetes bacterium]|nr:hypothetical protein [Bacteroidota bacterium]
MRWIDLDDMQWLAHESKQIIEECFRHHRTKCKTYPTLFSMSSYIE